MEFLIRCADGEWFNLPSERFADVLKPKSFPSLAIQGWGDHRITVRGRPVSFSYEDAGILVSFEGEPLPEVDAASIVKEIAENVATATGQKSYVVPL